MNSLNQQAYLADFAPKQSLDKYAKGADPRVISGIVALSEMQQQAAMRQQANLASGAAQGQMPTVRDKIMQMFQQANQPRQQPQQQPNPMQQGIMAQAHPQMQTAPMPQEEAPEEAQMYHGGVAHLPVNDRMFGYANGGIIAFRTGERPEDKEDYNPETDDSLPKDEAEASLRRMQERTEGTSDERTSTAGDVARGIAAAAGKVGDWWSGLSRQREMNAERMSKLPGFFEALTPNERAARMAEFKALGQKIKDTPLMSQAAPTTPPATEIASNKPQLQAPRTLVGDAATEQDRLAKAHAAFQSGQKMVGGHTLSETIEIARKRLEDEGKKLTPDDVRVIQRRFEGANPDAGSVGIKTLPEAKPAAVSTTPPQRTAAPSGNATVNPNAPAAGTGIDALLTQQANRLAAQGTPVGPQLPEPDMVASGLKYLEAQEKYVREQPNSPAADKLLQYYENMRKRAIADDNAQLAQRAEDDRNNLWTFLSNTRGSSLGVAAGKANAALQPLLSEQKAAAAAYRKYSYDRDLSLNKADAELRMAEEARRRGEFGKAIEHEQKERTYRLEAKKAEDTAQHYRNTEMNQVLSTAATRESAKESHLTQIQVANINAAAQRAGFNKPSESKQLTDEYLSRVQKDGQAAADAWLKSVGKVLGVTKGYDTREGSLDVARHKEVRTALENDNVYNSITRELNKMEKAALKKPLDKEQAAYLQRLRTRQQELYNNKYRELYREAPTAQPSGETGGAGAAPQRVTSEEEYNKLPPGTKFTAPDGSVRVKP